MACSLVIGAEVGTTAAGWGATGAAPVSAAKVPVAQKVVVSKTTAEQRVDLRILKNA